MEASWDESESEPDGLDELDVFGSSGGRPRRPAWPATTPSPGSTRSRRRCRVVSIGPSSRRCAGRWPKRWSPVPTWSSRQAPGPASPWPTSSLSPSRASRPSWPPPPRRCRTNWPRRTCRWSRRVSACPVPLDFAVLKGRSNYICRQRVAEVGSGGIQPELDDQGPGRADEAEGASVASPRPRRPRAWSTRSVASWPGHRRQRSGDRADLSFEPSDRAWNMLSVGPRECPGAYNCPSGGRCFAEAARDRAAAADIVVVNTHLYGAHLASGGAVLPDHDVVVFDEAHELEEVMTSSLGVEVTPGRFRSIVAAARPQVEERDRDLLDSLASVGERLGALLGDRVGHAGPARGRPAAGRRPRAGRAAPPGRRAQPACDRRAATHGWATQLPRRRRRCDRLRPRQPQDPHAAGRGAPGGGPASTGVAHRGRGGLGGRDPAQCPAAPLPR